jgi:biopolymer transport protein ExbD
MGVKIPGYHIKSHHDLKEMRYRLKGSGHRRALSEELTLTSLIDFFATLIIFLIQSFSANGELILLNKDISPPTSQHARALNRAPVVTVFQDKVILEGFQVGDNTDIEQKIEETDWELPQLQRALIDYKKFFESIHQGVKFPPEVVIQADKGLDFLYVKRVLYTLVKIEFSNINLLVRGEPVADIYESIDAANAAAAAQSGTTN